MFMRLSLPSKMLDSTDINMSTGLKKLELTFYFQNVLPRAINELTVFYFLRRSILLWNVCFNRHSMTGVVIENKNQIKIEATEKDFVDSHGKYFVIRFEKGKENRNDDFLVGDQVIVKYDGIIYESNPAVIDAKSVKRKE